MPAFNFGRTVSQRFMPFHQRARALDFGAGVQKFKQDVATEVVQAATPVVVESARIAAENTVYNLFQVPQEARASVSGSGGFSFRGVSLQYGQGIANIGGRYVVTNEAGRGGSTSAAKSILSSYNKYKTTKQSVNRSKSKGRR